MKKNELNQEVSDLIKSHLEQKQISQNKLAETIGVSNGTISNILNGVLERINESMLLKIKSFFKSSEWNIIETHNFLFVKEACAEAKESHRLIGIIGYTGAGKTTALRDFFKKKPNTYLVTCGRAMRTKQLLSEILKALGVNYLASDYEMVQMIIEEINKKENPLLIIDEASKLSPNALMYLQDIWDGIEDGAGLIIAGTEYLINNIKKGAEKNKCGMAEFYGRVSKWVFLQLPIKAEVEAVCRTNGLDDSQTIKSMLRAGSFRIIKNTVRNYLNTI
ncbi:hypothetical protein AX766_04215 [Flavobacterium covae]|uniref:AAA family ATPase n=1 Tax=Flavobacterium covae TaxID=2906076 RepID=UPI0007C17B76|nr:AAA family ATPase [Flavobacterium covae]AND63644.1 hypothetical protein AX766_04085 [Flavobacterium covae]AND63669.1 hypothetical protein AX766_04215 [Flavobacterium covae]